MTTHRMGGVEVRLYAAISDSDLPFYLGAFAEIALDFQRTAMWRAAGTDWYRTVDTLESLRDRDYVIHESSLDGLDKTDPEAFPTLRHLLEQLAVARQIATEAHADQVDKNGDPYLQHPKRVAARVTTLRGQAVAWLHDVLEDTEVDEQQLREAGLDPEVLQAVLALTRSETVSDAAYSEQIRTDPLTLEVKLADIADNLDPARTARLDPEVRDRLAKKYEHARRALGALEEQA